MKICVVAGEASGDLHAAELIRELKLREPGLEMFGIGGERLRAEGVSIAHDIRELGVVGLFNVVRQLPMFRRVFREISAEIAAERPDAVILVDYPDFNLRLARRCKEMGLTVIYYISPQVWAWRRRRVHHIARWVDHMLVLFPFEESFYREHSVPVTYVGHPLVEQLHGIERPRSGPHDPLRIALLPGSRRMEVETLLPPMIDGVRELRRDRSVAAFLVKAPTIDRAQLIRILGPEPIDIREGRSAVAEADLSFCSSGTATLETALMLVPSIVVYRLTPLSYALARRLVHLPHFSLINIIAGRSVVPELLQGAVRGDAIAACARELLEPARYAALLDDLDSVRRKLGEGGASARAAEKIATLIRSRGSAA